MSPDDVLKDAEANLEYRSQSKDGAYDVMRFLSFRFEDSHLSAELIDSYLNGPRTLSNTRLSYLVVSRAEQDPAASLLTPPLTPSLSAESLQPSASLNNEDGLPHSHFDLLICAMHFIGDGMALHTFANDFFGLLGSEKSNADLEAMLQAEWTERWQGKQHDVSGNSLPFLGPDPDELLLVIDPTKRFGREHSYQVEQAA